ncbi:MAG: phosphatase PAP2 family protein [Verrucomicrobiota bacterium]
MDREIRGDTSGFFRDLIMAEEVDPAEELAPSGTGEPLPDPIFRCSWVWGPLLFLLVATVLIRVFHWDLRLQESIYAAGDGSWALGEGTVWQLLYKFGTIPALILTLGTLVAYVASLSREKWKAWQRVLLFILLTAVTGPGFITNLGLKETWGRPRPREVEGLGGHNAFEPVLTINRESDGKSFPCGHCTMGYLFLGGFFLLRHFRKGLAIWIVIGSLLAGSLTGVARMMQGGHFLSDVIWAAAICWFVPMGLYFALGLHRGLRKEGGLFDKTPRLVKVLSWIAGLSLFTAAMFATPFRSQPDYFLVSEEAKADPIHVQLLFELGDIDITGSEAFRIHGEAYGHGVPTSKLATIYEEREKEDLWEIWYMERISGRVNEVNQQLNVEVPIGRTELIGLRTGEARIWLELYEPEDELVIHLYEGAGEIRLLGSEIPHQIERAGEEAEPVEGAKIRIIVHETFGGELSVELAGQR